MVKPALNQTFLSLSYILKKLRSIPKQKKKNFKTFLSKTCTTHLKKDFKPFSWGNNSFQYLKNNHFESEFSTQKNGMTVLSSQKIEG